MMFSDTTWLSILMAVVGFLAGAIASVSGFGIGSLLTPVVAARVGTKRAVAAVSVPQVTATALRCWIMRKHVDRRLHWSFGLTHKRLSEWLNKLDIEYQPAMSFLRSCDLSVDAFRARCLSVEMLKDREFFFGADRQGRVHTNLTNLWSQLRQFLRIQGEELVNIDIANSQPLFFGLFVW